MVLAFVPDSTIRHYATNQTDSQNCHIGPASNNTVVDSPVDWGLRVPFDCDGQLPGSLRRLARLTST
jgi:hypothetical protein